MVSMSDSIKHFNNGSCCMRKNPSPLQNVYDGATVNAILFFVYISAYMSGLHSLCLCSFIIMILISTNVLVNYRLHVSEVENKNIEFLEGELLRLIDNYNKNMKESISLCGIDESDDSDDDMPPLISASEIHYDKNETIKAKFSDYNTIDWPNEIYSQKIPVVREILEASRNKMDHVD
jgi:hypothetical protein